MDLLNKIFGMFMGFGFMMLMLALVLWAFNGPQWMLLTVYVLGAIAGLGMMVAWIAIIAINVINDGWDAEILAVEIVLALVAFLLGCVVFAQAVAAVMRGIVAICKALSESLRRRREARRALLENERRQQELRRQEEERRQRERDRLVPRMLAETFYEEHRQRLRGRYPLAQFVAFLNRRMHEGVPQDAMWQALDEWLPGMKVLVAEEQAREEKERAAAGQRARQIRDLDRQIEECRRRIESIARHSADPDTIREETASLEANIERMENEKELLALADERMS